MSYQDNEYWVEANDLLLGMDDIVNDLTPEDQIRLAQAKATMALVEIVSDAADILLLKRGRR